MFDTFESNKFFKKFPFIFNASRFEIWVRGEKVKEGKTSNQIKAEVNQTNNQHEIVSLTINDPSLFTEMANINTFDTVFTLNDRIVLVTIPEPSKKDTVGIMSMRTFSGITRPGKRFNSTEPFCCSLFLNNKKISKVTFTFNNPEKLIEFYFDASSSVAKSSTQKIDTLAQQILLDVKSQQLKNARQKMIELFSIVKSNPIFLGQSDNPENLGKAFVLMLNNRVFSDDDVIESIACIAYVLVTTAILQKPSASQYLNRLVILEFSREQFNYSIRSALDVDEGGSINFFSVEGQMGGTKARDAIFKMEIYDLYNNPILYQQVDFCKRKKIEFDEMIADNFFYNKRLPDLIAEGKANHEKAYKFFYNKIIVNKNIEI